MRQLTKQLANWARGFFAPTGRRRKGHPILPTHPQLSPHTEPRIPVAETVRAWYEPIDGTTTALVRPYLTAYEPEEQTHLQRLRHDALRRAAYGVISDPQGIHSRLGAA